MKWNWSIFWITVAALTTTVVVIVPAIDKAKETAFGGQYVFGEGEEGVEI